MEGEMDGRTDGRTSLWTEGRRTLEEEDVCRSTVVSPVLCRRPSLGFRNLH